jgi:ribonuclease HII
MGATFELELNELQLHGGPIVGVDEAGRGPLAGPLVAAAVILNPSNIPAGIADSKSLDADTRERVFAIIRATSKVGISVAGVDRIDRDNILNATLWAMAEAVDRLECQPRLVLVDGNMAPQLASQTRSIIKGDAKCLSIAAASIVAKVTRDRLMTELGHVHPGYGFERHKGYGTREHHAAIKRLGVTSEHRRSFKPVQLLLGLV